MARELVLDVVARRHTDDLNRVAAEFDKLADRTDRAGKAATRNVSAMSTLDAELVKARRRVADLGAEYNRTASVDVFRNLKSAQRDVAQLEGVKRTLTKALSDAGDAGGRSFWQRVRAQGKSIGHDAAQDFGQGFFGFLKSPAGLGVAAVAAVASGQAIGGALLTGVGLAGIGVGIAGQLHDPAVQAALHRFANDTKAGLKDATSGFKQPLIAAIDDFDRRMKAEQPALKATFDQLAPLVGDLERGLARGIGNALPGIEKALAASAPLVKSFSQFIAQEGGEIGKLFDAVASHSKGALEGLRTIETGVLGITAAVRVAIPVFDALGQAIHLISTTHAIELAFGSQAVNSARVSVQDLTTAAFALGTAMITAAGGTSRMSAAAALAQQMTDHVLNSFLALDQANLGVAQSLTQVTDALKQNKRSLDIHTAAGQADRSAVLAAVSANIQQYDALIQSGIGAQDAARAYDANTAALERQLRKAGLTAAQIDGLIGKYRGVPSRVNTVIATQGLTQAITDLTDLLYKINHIPREKLVTVRVQTFGVAGLNSAIGKLGHKAAGGPVMAGQAYVVGENRPELFIPQTNGTILPRVPDTVSYGAKAGLPAWRGGGGAVNLSLAGGQGGTSLERALLPLVYQLFRNGAIVLEDSTGTKVRVRG